jgi:hypothetical protein
MNHRYYVLTSSNGTVSVDKEYDDLTAAIVGYHGTCAAFWNAPDVIEGIVQLVYSADLAVVNNYTEKITHPETQTQTQPQPQTNTEQTAEV